MNAFIVLGMTCGHGVSSITNAVKAPDPRSRVQIDLATRRVEIEFSDICAAQLSAVIKRAGCTPVAIQPVARAAMTGAARVRSGCCCG